MGTIQIFLSYNSSDREAVVAVRRFLCARGITTFLDRDNLVTGLPWPLALEQSLKDAKAAAIFIGRELGGWQKREMGFALDRQVREEKKGKYFPVIPVLLPGADLTPGFIFLNTWIDLRTGYDGPEAAEAIGAMERAINATAPAPAPTAGAEHAAVLCPYRGLEAFREEDSAFFAGRSIFAKQLLDFAQGKDMMAVVGPSGSGKSSIVQAGLVPLLRRQRPPAKTWDAVAFTPGNDPFHRLASAVIPLLEPDLREADRLAEAEKLGRNLNSGDTRLEAVIGRAIEKSNGTGRLLVVADQFEELFTIAPERDRRPFARALLRALGSAPFTLLMTLRADFYGQVITLDRELSDRIASAQVNIGALSADELRESITRPARLVGLDFEPGLTDRILGDAGGEPGSLPLVEFALSELWSRRRDKTLTNAAYNEIGGVTGALAMRAETEFARFTQDEQKAARRLFSRLVRVARPEEGAEDTRQRLELQATDAVTEKVGRALARADVRLLVAGRDDQTGKETIEVAHEALITNWERLRGWLNEDREFLLWRQRLRVALEGYERSRDDTGTLLRGAPLAEAEHWLATRPQDLADAERQFVGQSITLREQDAQQSAQRRERDLAQEQRLRHEAEMRARVEQSSARRTKIFALFLAVLLLGALALALAAWRQEKLAKSRELAASAETLLSQGKPGEALATGIKAFSIEDTSQAREAIVGSFPQKLSKLEGHSGPIYAAEFSPDGHRVVTASADGTARVWNAATGQMIAKLEGHSFWVNDAAFSPDGRLVVTAGADKTARVWSAATGQGIAKLEGHSDRVASAAFSPDGHRVVTASFDRTARVWNAATGQMIAKLEGHSDVVNRAAFSSDGQRVVTTSADRTARVWNAATGRVITKLEGSNFVYGAAFSPDGQRVVTANGDGTARVWNAATGQVVAKLERHSGGGVVLDAEFSPDGHQVVTARYDRTTCVWNAGTGEVIAELKSDSGHFETAAFSPDGQRVLTLSDDGTARVWNAATGQVIAMLEGSNFVYVYRAKFSPDGQRVLTVIGDYTAQLWNIEATGELITKLEGHSSNIWNAAFSPDGQRVVTASGDKTARVWDAATGHVIAILEGHSKSICCAAFSPDGQRVATASEDGTARLWNAGTGQVIAKMEGHSERLIGAAFSLDGQRVVTASVDGTARVWNAATGQVIAKMEGHSGPVDSAAFSPDGQWVVTASEDRTARVWHAVTGQVIAKMEGHSGPVDSAAFSPDGHRVVTASADGTARVWNAATGQVIAKMEGHSSGLFNAAFSPDGHRVVTASFDRTARVWNAATGQVIAKLEGHPYVVLRASFSADGQRVVTASEDHTARVWNAATGQLIAKLEGHSGRVEFAAFSPDGQRVVMTSDYTTALIFRIVTLDEIAHLLASK